MEYLLLVAAIVAVVSFTIIKLEARFGHHPEEDWDDPEPWPEEASLPDSDSPSPGARRSFGGWREEAASPVVPIGPMELKIVYETADGAISERLVTASGVQQRWGRFYLHGYCHQRHAPRMFRVDRILESIDMETGVVIPPQAFAALPPEAWNE